MTTTTMTMTMMMMIITALEYLPSLVYL